MINLNGQKLFEVKPPEKGHELIKLVPCRMCQSNDISLKSENNCHGHGSYSNEYWIQCEKCGYSTKRIDEYSAFYGCRDGEHDIFDYTRKKWRSISDNYITVYVVKEEWNRICAQNK